MNRRARLVYTLLLVATPATAQPPNDAEQHHRRGLELLRAATDYAAAIEAFAAAYRLDQKPRYLYNLALAQRLANKCGDAIESYRAYLATGPSEDNAANARIGIERCEQTLAAAKPVVDPPKPIVTPPVVPAVRDRRDVVSPTTRGPWYRDRLGNGLAIAGGVSVLASAGLYLLARDAAAATFDAGPLADYETQRDRTKRFQVASVVTAGIGVALVAGGIVRYSIRPTRTVDVTVAPTSTGGTVVIGGSF